MRGLALFADGGEGHLFSFWWNSPAMAACGCVRAFSEALRRGDPFAIAFYKKMLQGMVSITGCKDRQTISAEDLLRRWDAEDLFRAVQETKKKPN